MYECDAKDLYEDRTPDRMIQKHVVARARPRHDAPPARLYRPPATPRRQRRAPMYRRAHAGYAGLSARRARAPGRRQHGIPAWQRRAARRLAQTRKTAR